MNIENQIIQYLKQNKEGSSTNILEGIDSDKSLATLKRILTSLINEKLIKSVGKGKATKYRVSQYYKLFEEIDIESYYSKEIDEREIKENFNLSIIQDLLPEIDLLTQSENLNLEELQIEYSKNISKLSKNEYNKELERLAIDLSWKSSQIEGNTYSLLETERLIKEKEVAQGKSKEEATMLLNHKEVLDFIIENPDYLFPLSLSKIEDIHSILIKDLKIDRNIRKRRVGISGTNYKPLDNEFQIKEALISVCNLINKKDDVFEQALLALILISYIQPFSDGNKRTARIISNAILINQNHCPISFRTVDSIDYKKAMLLFYEQNNVTAFKRVFIEQLEFAVKTYF
ncbi:MAG: Fic family protein [Bacteroidales bacterium]|nr:Fic family protein [Bacteroidales bacterium]